MLAALAVSACAPPFNWRQTAIAATPLSAMFPCKPEQDRRTVPMAGRTVELHMHHCATAGITAAVGYAQLPEPAMAGAVLAQWRTATLSAMHLTASTQSPWTMERATVLPEALAVNASGTTARGEPVVLRAAWFARGTAVYAALFYGPVIDPDAAEVFFTGLQFR